MPLSDQHIDTEVLVIGGGATGAGILRDLTLRGFHCILVERGDLNAGASGANHGLLHSGARYASSDPQGAMACAREGKILKKMAPHLIEETGGLFAAVSGDDEHFVAEFPGHCRHCGIVCREVDAPEAREMEPALSHGLMAAYAVEDATIDPFGLVLDQVADALNQGGRLLLNTPVVEIRVEQRRIREVVVRHRYNGRQWCIRPRMVVNASGAWAGEVASMAGVPIHVLYSKGSLVITNSRVSGRVINRLRPPSNGDIVVPGGTVSVVGTTSLRIDSLDRIRPELSEAELIISQAREMLPCLETARYIRAYAGVRPLAGGGTDKDDRHVSRGFTLLDHDRDGIDNFMTIIGGKLTTFRLMAERTVDLVCRKTGRGGPCMTQTLPLPSSSEGRWTRPGQAPRQWLAAGLQEDPMLCECEMVSHRTVSALLDHIRKEGGETGLAAIGSRSRVGKGTCQGAFCGFRVLGMLYDNGDFTSRQGVRDLSRFLNSRWKGIRPVLWGPTLAQEELQEALHCGLFGLELPLDPEGNVR